MRPVILLAGLLALAANLRAALAGYPPLLETASRDLETSAGAAGLVQSAAVLMMAAGSFAGSAIGRRFGREPALGGSVALVAVGSLVRAVPALAALVGGSLLIGFGIGVAGVLLAGAVKEHLPARAGAVTGAYVVAMMAGSTVASAVAAPLSTEVGWSRSLAVWAVPAVVAVAAWMPIARRVPRTERPVRAPLPWRSRFARLAACYQAGTSLAVYGWLTWLPPYYESQGFSPERAGMLLAAWSLAHIPAALLVPVLAERRRRWRFWSGLMLACGVLGTLGVLLLPVPPVVGPWPWVVLIGLACGAGFPLGLAVIAWRTPDATTGAATSGLALGVSYLAAGTGPLLMGLLVDATGGFPAAIAVLLVAAAVQAFAIAGVSASSVDTHRPAPRMREPSELR